MIHSYHVTLRLYLTNNWYIEDNTITYKHCYCGTISQSPYLTGLYCSKPYMEIPCIVCDKGTMKLSWTLKIFQVVNYSQ